MEDMINKELEVCWVLDLITIWDSVVFPKGAPERLLAVSKTAEELERSLYSAYRGWRKIPQTDVRMGQYNSQFYILHILYSMHMCRLNKSLNQWWISWKETDEERKEFLESLFYSLDYHSMLPLVVTMFQKYREVCPDKPGLLKGWCKNWNVVSDAQSY